MMRKRTTSVWIARSGICLGVISWQKRVMRAIVSLSLRVVVNNLSAIDLSC